MASSTRPRSLAGFFASGRVLPASPTRLPSLTGCVIRGCALPPAVCAKAVCAKAVCTMSTGHDAKPNAIAAGPGVRGSDDACTGAWYTELRRRYYHIMPGLEQNQSNIGRRAALPRNIIGAQQFGGNGGGYNG